MNLPHIIKKPRITEKSHLEIANNCYTFDVDPRASKTQIATAIEAYFEVEVKSVRTISNKAENKRTGRRRLPAQTGRTKKAIVKLKEGNSIALFESPEAPEQS